MKLAPTYKVDLNGSIRMHVVEVEGNKYRTESGLIDGARVISEWTECFGKNVGKSNGTTDEEQALKVAQRIRQIRLEQGDYENIEDAGAIKMEKSGYGGLTDYYNWEGLLLTPDAAEAITKLGWELVYPSLGS